MEEIKIDTARGMEFSMDDKEMYQDMVQMFVEQKAENVSAITDFFEKQDWENYKIRVHGLKSNARMVGAVQLMGDPSSYMSTMEIGYRVKFDIKNKKAHVVMYNVQFNPHMPKMECLILPDLDVDFNNNGYAIEAENISPLYIEGGKLMENPSFPFTTFKFTAETNMVEANCEFTVAGRFEGFFKGNYMETIVE